MLIKKALTNEVPVLIGGNFYTRMSLLNQTTQIDKKDAVKILQERGSVNDQEKRWAANHIEYLNKYGRNFFYKVVLEKTEFMNLTFGEKLDEKKVNENEDKFRKEGYSPNSFLFLRDPNNGEVGSFYVENGKHRVAALRNLIIKAMISFPIVNGIIVCRQKLSQLPAETLR